MWGNHSPTMYPDYRFATVGGKSLKDLINDENWNRTTFLPTVAGNYDVGGFTLGGGYGWLSSKYGLACDNLVGAGLHLNAVGGDCPGKTELHADILLRKDARVVVEFEPLLFDGVHLRGARRGRRVRRGGRRRASAASAHRSPHRSSPPPPGRCPPAPE